MGMTEAKMDQGQSPPIFFLFISNVISYESTKGFLFLKSERTSEL